MDLWEAKAGPRQPVGFQSRADSRGVASRYSTDSKVIFWVRLLYTHPAHWSGELMRTIAECDKVRANIDIPLQHIDESMLGRYAT